MTTALFTVGASGDTWYSFVRDLEGPRDVAIRSRCEQLWAGFEPYADEHFLIEIRDNFHARFWEMYLAVTLLRLGYEIFCPKPGPDAGILVDGRRIWFEAVAPKPGDPASRDKVPQMVAGEFGWVPIEQIILRYPQRHR